jgi:hypothetical protein
MSPKGLCVEGLVPSAALFRGGSFGRLLYHEVSDLMGGLTH